MVQTTHVVAQVHIKAGRHRCQWIHSGAKTNVMELQCYMSSGIPGSDAIYVRK